MSTDPAHKKQDDVIKKLKTLPLSELFGGTGGLYHAFKEWFNPDREADRYLVSYERVVKYLEQYTWHRGQDRRSQLELVSRRLQDVASKMEVDDLYIDILN